MQRFIGDPSDDVSLQSSLEGRKPERWLRNSRLLLYHKSAARALLQILPSTWTTCRVGRNDSPSQSFMERAATSRYWTIA